MGKVSTKLKRVGQERTVGVILVAIFVLIFTLILFIAFNRASNDRNSADNSNNTQLFDQNSKLIQNAANSSVTILIENGVTADENHYSIEMTVSANSRNIRVLKGYQNIEERTEDLANNLEAYKAFLSALEKYNFTEARDDDSGFSYREACPTSKLYRFKLNSMPATSFDRWYTTCSNKRYGDYNGKVNFVHSLFRNQFPNYSTNTRGIRL